MSRVLVLGASGMLGHKVCQRLRGHQVTGVMRRPASDLEEVSALRETCLLGGVDLLESGALETAIANLQPEVVVNCVGLVKQLDEAHDPCLAVALNALLPHRLAKLCAEQGARLIHISTDCVFAGNRGRYRESDPVDATDLYGMSKALGETLPEEDSALTLRTSFIGRELRKGHHGLLEWFLASVGTRVQGYDGVIYSGLTALELSGAIQDLVENGAGLSGVYHLASEPITKYELLRLVRRIYDLDIEIERAAQPVSDRSLLMDRFLEATGRTVPTWQEMIQQMYDDPTPYPSDAEAHSK